MVNYICLRCNYNTDRKSNFINHLSRKKICKVSKTDVTINYMMDVYNLSDCKKIKKIKKKECFNCIGCNKNFNRKNNMERHTNSCIKYNEYVNDKYTDEIKKQNDVLINKVEEMLNKMNMMEEELKKIKDKPSINNNFNKIETNIQINSFGNENFDYINEYFELKDINLDLTKENLFLKNQLEKVKQYSNLDSLKNINFTFRNAKVISNNLSSFKNHLIINKGVRHGLKNEMGVINSTGIVGIINRTSKNYSSVMSVLNIDTKINAKVKRTSHFGTLEWNGRRTSYLVLNDIPETANIKVGDSIITGGMSLIFPEGINIGVVSEILNQNKISDTVVRFKGNIDEAKYLDFDFKENYLTVKVKLHTDMNNLNNVYVIESLNREEFQKIKK